MHRRTGFAATEDVLAVRSGRLSRRTAVLPHEKTQSVAVSQGPLERARALGVHGTVRVGAEQIPSGAFDVVLECSGVPAAVSPALVGARRGGVVVQVGMVPDEARPVNLAPLVSKELQLRGSFRFDDEIDEAIGLLADRPGIEDVVTHEFPADRAVEAFATARDSAVSGKVLVSLAPGEPR